MAIRIAEDAYLSSDSLNIIFTYKIPKISGKGKKLKKDGSKADLFKWKTMYFHNLHMALDSIVDVLIKRSPGVLIRKSQNGQEPETLEKNVKSIQDLSKIIRIIGKRLMKSIPNINPIDLVGKVKV